MSVKMSIKLREFDPSRHLDSEEAIALYLEEIIEDDPDMLIIALGDVARARGMTELAEKTGLARESLYQALSENGNPTFSTLRKVLDAFGVRFSIRPQHESAGAAV
jgi:probable addiction module antidote protein